ncbi:MAG TPA: alpha/beta hydrolase [Granulicella sp.]|nr:alpha/beta hydrolase [Granulicella sp.]
MADLEVVSATAVRKRRVGGLERSGGRRLLMAVLLLASVAVFAAAGWPIVRAHLQAIAVLRMVAGQPVPWMVGKVVADPIVKRDISFQIAGETAAETVRARLYLPNLPRTAGAKAKQPALIVLHGVHYLGIDEPRLEAFATAMASCGIRVLTPELPDIKDYHVDASSIRTIGESAQWFARRAGAPVGVMGLSFSGGLALEAAADPAYAAAFRFVMAVGAQDDMTRVANYYRTGEDERPNGTVERLAAHPYGPLVLEYEYVQDFVPAKDVPAIRSVLREDLYEDKGGERLALAALTKPERTEAARLLAGTSPATRAMIGASNAKHAAELAELSPHGDLKRLKTPVYLLHGEADNIIPAAETLWLERDLPRGTLQAALISPVISHIDFESSRPSTMDEWRLTHFFALVMQAAEQR